MLTRQDSNDCTTPTKEVTNKVTPVIESEQYGAHTETAKGEVHIQIHI